MKFYSYDEMTKREGLYRSVRSSDGELARDIIDNFSDRGMLFVSYGNGEPDAWRPNGVQLEHMHGGWKKHLYQQVSHEISRGDIIKEIANPTPMPPKNEIPCKDAAVATLKRIVEGDVAYGIYTPVDKDITPHIVVRYSENAFFVNELGVSVAYVESSSSNRLYLRKTTATSFEAIVVALRAN